jgi:hypothetical protein
MELSYITVGEINEALTFKLLKNYQRIVKKKEIQQVI